MVQLKLPLPGNMPPSVSPSGSTRHPGKLKFSRLRAAEDLVGLLRRDAWLLVSAIKEHRGTEADRQCAEPNASKARKNVETELLLAGPQC